MPSQSLELRIADCSSDRDEFVPFDTLPAVGARNAHHEFHKFSRLSSRRLSKVDANEARE